MPKTSKLKSGEILYSENNHVEVADIFRECIEDYQKNILLYHSSIRLFMTY